MKKFLLSIVFLSLSVGAFAQLISPFTIRYQTTQKGGIRYISNTSVTCSGIGCGAGRTEVPPAGTSTDNGFTAAYVDIDADGTTFSSSSDSLSLPLCSQISFAGLYWGGEMDNTAANYATRNQCKIKVNNGAYAALTATSLQDNNVGFNTYHCFKDITSIVTAAGTNARFTLANVAVRTGGTNRFGGWTIVVVYKNDLLPMRNLTVFNGLSNVSGANPITDVTVSGFLTPLSGPVTFEVGNLTYDGDRSSTGDQLMFNGGSGFVNISDAVNPLNDIFNSTLSYNGVQKTAPFINPSYTNSLGLDADIFIPNNAAKNYIGNSATSATLRLTTGGETYLTQVVSIAIDVYEPDLRAACRVVDLNGGSVLPGDILEYTIVGKNIGSDPAVNVYITDTLEFNAVYVPGSLSITSGPNTGAKTDAVADDQAEYTAANKTLKIRVGTGANNVTGGQMNNSPLGIDSTQIKFRAMATTDCVILQCDNIINNRAYIFGTGNVSGNAWSNGSNPDIFDGSGCPVPGSTASPISAASCPALTASSNSPVCTGSTISLSTSPASTTATYSWTGPGGFVSTATSPTRAGATAAMAGTYTCVISVPPSACSYTVTTTVAVNTTPATPAPSSNSPVCTGNTINLSTAAVAGATYSWTGPSAFSSALQNPTRAGATAAMAGTYSVTVTAGGCTSAVGTTAVVVNATPATPAPSSNTPVCTGNTINLSTAAVAGATYSWTGPSAFSSALQNPTRAGATAAMAGTYSVTVTTSGCTSAVGTTVVVVNTTPATPTASSNTPVCTGNTINLSTPAVAGATYSWTGPNSFSSAVQNPSITSSTVAMAGTYSVTVTTTGCTSAVGTTAVVVNTTPATPAASSNSPVCTGNTINLSTPAVAGATYSWTGPSSFSSAVQNPSITGATVAMAGTYSITVTTTGCTSAAGTVAVVVNTTPATPTASSNTPVCTGNTINLSTPAVAGATYSWTGPNSFSSAVQNPSITGATVAMAGTYSVTVTTTGCTSAVGTTAVVINATPATPAASSNSPVCTGNTINLSTPAVAGATYSWTGPNTFSSSVQNPSITGATVAMAGTYSVTVTTSGCTSAVGTVAVVVNTTPAIPTASSNSPVCTGNTINLSTPAVAGATYSWTGPSAFSSALQNPARAGATAAMAGTYSVTVTTTGCTSAVGTTAVVINATPATPAASSNSPVCTGNTINLSTPAVAGATYSWTGPNSFSSAVQNPSITGATVAMAGTYSITVTTTGCTSAAGTVAVVVNTTPATPSASSNSPVCTGNTINLSTPAVAGATYSWTGPNSFSSAVQNPSITGATAAMAGTYSITVTTTGCTSAVGTTAVVVNPTPATPTGSSNTPVCTGNTINLSTPAVAGATYSWTGPNSFTSSVQNPSIISATIAMAGTYSVTVTTTGCTSAVGTTAVVINTTPAMPAASSNSPVCTGNTINLSTPAVAGATYSWTGPNSFSSSVQNPSITSVTAAMAGTYSVTVTTTGCTSAVGTTAVVVNATPATPTASSNSPVCTGNTINLSTPAVAGATYSWTGPSAFSSSVQNPSRPGATAAMAGTYSVTVTTNGCTSAVGTTAVIINATPSTPAPSSNSPVCTGNTINLSTAAVAGATYSWTGPNSFSSAVQNPSITSATAAMAGTYSLTVTTTGCTSAVGTTAVVVNATPATPAASSNSPVCTGNTINLSTPAVAGATYSWTGPSAFSSSVQNPSRPGATAAMAGTYSLTVTTTGCTSAVGTTAVIINTTPATPAASSNTPVCTGNTINLSTPAVAGATYSWTGPNSFSSAVQNPSVTSATAAMAGTYSVTVTTTGCTSAAGTTAVVINATPAVPVLSSNSPVCTGNTINLGTTVTGVTYSWTGPAAFVSAVQNPSITGATAAMAGTYSLTVTASGCTSAPGTVAVVVSPPPSSPVAGSNTPVCTGNSVDLTASTVAGATYNWTGPNSFSSSSQNPSIPSATLLMAGTYSVTASIGTCVSPIATTSVVISTTPAAPTATSNSPVCITYPINLDAGTVGASTYSWTGPGSYSSSLQNSVITNATAAMSGTYSVTATENGCTSAPATVVVSVVDCSPAANPDNVTVNEDNSTIIPVLTNDTDPQSNINTGSVVVTSTPGNGTATVNADGTITYTPGPNYNGTDTFIYQICDNTSPTPFCDTALVTITVTPVNDAPVLDNDTAVTMEDTSVNGDVTNAGDFDPDGTTLTATTTPVDGPDNGTILINTDGTYTYTPNANFNGNDTVVVQVCDAGIPLPAICANDTIFITVTPVNDPPVVNDTTVITNEDTPVSVCLPILDPDSGQAYSVSSCGNPLNGTSTSTITGGQVCITYTPNANFNGTDSLCVVICDNGVPSLCDTTMVIFNVTPVNDPPVVNDTTTTVNEDTPVSICLPILDADSGQTYSVSSCGNPLNGTSTSTITGGQVCITYTPNPNFNGMDSLCVIVCDNGTPSLCDTAMIVINVTPVNDPPVVNDTTTTINEDTPVSICLPILDADSGQTYSVSSCGNPLNGTSTSTITGGQVCITYTPNTNFNGTDSLCVVICDNGTPSLCDTTMVTFNVTPVNDPPVIDNDTISTLGGIPASGDVTDAGDSDPDGTPLTTGTTPVDGPNNGTITVNTDGTYTYTPNTGFTGTDTVVVSVCDAGIPMPPSCMNDTIFINVGPAVHNETVSTTTNVAVNGNTNTNETPSTGFVYNPTPVDAPNNGTITVNGSGTFTYTPATGFSGYDTVVVNTCYTSITPSACSNDTIFITVFPDINNETVSTAQDSTISGTMGGTDSGTGLTYGTTPVDGPNSGTITVNTDGTFTYVPNPGYIGTDTVVVTVCDASTPPLCSVDTLFINVINGPVVVNEHVSGTTNNPITGNILSNDAPSGVTLGTLIDNTNNGTTVINNSTGGFTYTPNPGFSGYDTLIINVCFNSICIPDTVFITVNPDINNETVSVTSGGSVSSTAATNDSGTGLTYGTTPVDGPNNGTITVNTDGTFTYTPNTGYVGNDTVIVTVCDASVPPLCSVDTIFIQVANGPTVVNEHVSGTTGTPITGGILGNDSPTGVTVGTIVDNTNNGTTTVDNSTGGFTYTPNPGFSGYDTLIVNVCFGGVCAPDTVFITVNPDVNNETISVTSGSTFNGTMATNDSGTGLTYNPTPVDGPNNGTITVNTDGTFSYTPNTGYTGADTVIVTVCDASVPPLCSVDTIFINVMNGPSVVNEHVSGTTGAPITGGILGNDSPTGVTVGTIIDNTNNGTTVIDNSTGGFTYTPNPGFSGYDTLIINVCFGGVCAPDTVFITVYPDINNETVSVTSGGSVSGGMLPNDSGTGLTYNPTPVDGPNNGTITVNTDGTFSYTPNTGYTGADTVIVTVCDASVPPLCSVDTIFINVTNGPVIVNEHVSGNAGTPIPGNITSDDSPTGVTVGSVIDNTNNGTTVINSSTGGFTYTPNPGFSGYDTLIIYVCYGGVCVPDTVFITVYPDVNNDTGTSTNGGSTYTGNVLTNDSGSGLTADTTLVTPPVNGTVVMSSNGTYTYTPNPGTCGLDSFAYQACDNNIPKLCGTAWVYINVSCDTTPVVTDLFIPEGFSPNGDGINDNYVIRGIENYPNNTIMIFNRWGNKVFDAKPYKNTWDGTNKFGVRIGDDQLPVGTYFYILDLGDGSKVIKGYIYLNR